MNWLIYIYGVIGALALIEIYYALTTREVAWPLFGLRRKKAGSPALFWGLIVFWAVVFVGSIYSATSP